MTTEVRASLGWERLRPFAATYNLMNAGNSYLEKQSATKMIIDAPHHLLEQIASKAFRSLNRSQYCCYLIESRACKSTARACNQLISITTNVPSHAIGYVKQLAERHPQSRVCQWTLRRIEWWNQDYTIDDVRVIAQKMEAVFDTLDDVFCLDITSAGTLFMQDVQGIVAELRPYIELRNKVYLAIDAAPKKIITATYGSPKIRRNHFGRHSSPIVSKTAHYMMPKDKALIHLIKFKEKMLIVCKSVEQASAQALLSSNSENSSSFLQKAGLFCTRQGFRWLICDLTGWVIVPGVHYIQRMAGYEEEDMMSQETILKTHWFAKWALWTFMLNYEMKIWKAERAQAPQKMRDAAHEYVDNLREDLAQSIENLVIQTENKEEEESEEYNLSKLMVNNVANFIRGNNEQQQEPSLLGRGWNYVSSFWK